MTKIDVIIPIKGRPGMLRERSLPSLLKQTLQDFKVTIVDDGSSEDDLRTIDETAKEFSERGLDIAVLKNQGAPGAAGARNYGLSMTACPYLLWFDSDDILLPNKLDLSLGMIRAGDFNFAITRAQHIRDGELINEFWGEPQAPNRGKYEFHFPFQTMCALYKRSFLDEEQICWNENNNVIDDWEISNLAILSTDHWVYSPEVTAHYFVPTSASGSIGSRSDKIKILNQKLAIKNLQTSIRHKHLNLSPASWLRLTKKNLQLEVESTRVFFSRFFTSKSND